MGGAVFSRKGHPDRALGSEKEKPAQTRGPGTSALRRRPSSTQAQGPGTSALRGQGKWSRFLYLVVLADTDVVVVDFLSRCVGVDINVLIGCRD